MWVTCYTDASFTKRTGGSWAVWLRSERGRVVRSGKCPSYVRCSSAAELAAIYAGVFLAVREWGPSVRGLWLRSDSQDALRLADAAARPPRNPGLRILQQKLRTLVADHDLSLECRWVKGHQPRTASTAAWLNVQCDKLARRRTRTELRKRTR